MDEIDGKFEKRKQRTAPKVKGLTITTMETQEMARCRHELFDLDSTYNCLETHQS
jgi:hypothetical protein